MNRREFVKVVALLGVVALADAGCVTLVGDIADCGAKGEGAMPDQKEVALPGVHKNHLQDVWFDSTNAVIYWAHTDELIATDTTGKILRQKFVGEHHAGIGLRDGRLYVATCTMKSLSGGQAEKDSYVTVGEFDAKTLELIAYHKTSLNDRSGSLAIREDGTFLVGCLRPRDVTATQVKFHHLDKDFKLIRTYIIDNVPVRLGIETIKIRDGFTYLHVAPIDAKSKHLAFDTVKLDANFKEVWRGKMHGDRGIFFDGKNRWCGFSNFDGATKTWHSRLVRNPR